VLPRRRIGPPFFAVVRALSEWKYNEGAAGRTATVELAFKAR
jgi:hypothetical protein